MKKQQRTVYQMVLCAVLSALSLVLMLLAGILPSGWVGVTALAGLGVGIAMSAAGPGAAALCYGVSALLSLLFVPMKQAAVIYTLFCGCYPMVKSFSERLKRRAVEWGIKLAFFNAMLVLSLLCFQFLLQIDLSVWIGRTLTAPFAALLWITANLIFAAYDVAFSQVMSLIQRRILPLFRRRPGR